MHSPMQYARFIFLVSSQGVKGYNNTCQCAYLAYLNDHNTSKTKQSLGWPKLPHGRNDPEALYTTSLPFPAFFLFFLRDNVSELKVYYYMHIIFHEEAIFDKIAGPNSTRVEFLTVDLVDCTHKSWRVFNKLLR